MLSLASGFIVTGISFRDNYDKISHALKNAADFNYDEKADLEENLLAYAKQKGFEEGLKNAAEKYAAFMKKTRPSAFINTHINAVLMSQMAGVPDEVEIPQKEEEPKTQKLQPEKKVAEPVQEKPIELVKFNFLDESCKCAFCGRTLTSWQLDKTGCCWGHSDCTCKEYKEAKIYNASLK